MKRILAILSIIILSSCSGIKKTPEPDPFFDTEKMAAIMTDVYLVEGSMTANRKSFVDLGVVPDEYIYEKHGIDSISFKQNFHYYADRVENFLEVFDIVDAKLTIIKDSINARQFNSKEKVPQLKSLKDIEMSDSLKSYPTDNK